MVFQTRNTLLISFIFHRLYHAKVRIRAQSTLFLEHVILSMLLLLLLLLLWMNGRLVVVVSRNDSDDCSTKVNDETMLVLVV